AGRARTTPGGPPRGDRVPPLVNCRSGDPSSDGSGRLFEHRDLLGAVAGERRPLPVFAAVAQPKTGEAGHEVELGRPDVAIRRGVVDEPAVDRHPMMRRGDLADEVVECVDSDVVGLQLEDQGGRTRYEA